MVEFEYQPWKKIVIHEVLKFPLQHFLSASSLNVQAGGVGRPLTWVDGVIFQVSHFRDTDDITREKLDGTIHYSAVSYAIHEDFQSEFKVAGNIRIPVVDLSGNRVFKKMVSWLKKNFEMKHEQETVV